MSVCSLCANYANETCCACGKLVCKSHSRCYTVRKEEQSRKVCLCSDCLGFIDGMKRKDRKSWTKSEGFKLKKMANRLIVELAAVGLILVVSLMGFVMWLWKRGMKWEDEQLASFKKEELLGYRIEDEGMPETAFDADKFVEELYSGESETFAGEEHPFEWEELKEEPTFTGEEMSFDIESDRVP